MGCRAWLPGRNPDPRGQHTELASLSVASPTKLSAWSCPSNDRELGGQDGAESPCPDPLSSVRAL